MGHVRDRLERSHSDFELKKLICLELLQIKLQDKIKVGICDEEKTFPLPPNTETRELHGILWPQAHKRLYK